MLAEELKPPIKSDDFGSMAERLGKPSKVVFDCYVK